ncbi:hypothetical protein [Hymenobacter sp. PAMC 26628]|uniref:hypothetical protein n=1 Tax=Hymenobacter sp. PAMC 26628 TaxID=1484118 RepID=UPI0007705A12|nr:hypothetical protein [Hymenobacter sp. PAMC 26628]AMJ66559.1 hypothetical protein AXW84_14830 [Hymenobacter sp. PAMC 26628]
METTFHLNANDLDANFLEALKKLFVGKDIVISVANEVDATEYLLSDANRKAALFKSMQEAESGPLISVNLNDYRAQ